MNTTSVPRPQPQRVRVSNYCWEEHPRRGHCVLPDRHTGPHWDPYAKTEW